MAFSKKSKERSSQEISREYPNCPLVGIGALIIEKNRILLIRRKNPPAQGEWSVPGGLVSLGETLTQAVCRETFEETGLRVQSECLVELLDRVFYDHQGRVRYHYVLADYLCSITGGTLKAGSDASEAAWFDQKQLDSLNLAPVTLRVVLKAFEMSNGCLEAPQSSRN